MTDLKTFKKICRDFFPKCKFVEWGPQIFRCICCYKSGKLVVGQGLPKSTICCFVYDKECAKSQFYHYKNADGSYHDAENYKTTPYNLKRILNNAKKAGA